MREFLYDVARTGLLIVTLLAAIWCLLFIDSCMERFFGPSVGPPPSYQDWEKKFTKTPKIRVRLSTPTGSPSVAIRSRNKMRIVRGAPDSRPWKPVPEGEAVVVKRRGEQLLLNGRPAGEGPVRFQTSGQELFELNNVTYRGSAVLRLHREGGLEVINRIRLDRYLHSVLRGEMKQGMEMEALRAQAIAARSYALWERMYQRNRNPAANYDVFDTTQSQRYRGITDERSRMRRAVKSTRGVVLIYQNDLLHAYYHSTCGGLTEHAAYALAHEEKPVPAPLQGGVECRWDSASQFYRWESTFTGTVLTNRIERLPQSVIEQLRVSGRTPNKRADQVTATFQGGKKVSVDAHTVQRALRGVGVRSNWYEFEERGGNRFYVRGKGWGHGVGMCQMGAVGAAGKGASYETILKHYYSGASLGDAYN